MGREPIPPRRIAVPSCLTIPYRYEMLNTRQRRDVTVHSWAVNTGNRFCHPKPLNDVSILKRYHKAPDIQPRWIIHLLLSAHLQLRCDPSPDYSLPNHPSDLIYPLGTSLLLNSTNFALHHHPKCQRDNLREYQDHQRRQWRKRSAAIYPLRSSELIR